MPPPASVNTMPRTSQISIDASSDVVSLRNFVVDEDKANFGSTLWKTIDKNSFILAQREALEAFNIAKAIRLSEETAVLEQQQSRAFASTTAGPSQPHPRPQEIVPPQAASSSSGGRPSQSQPVPIQRKDATPHSTPDEAAARSLARSWQVDGIQTTLLDNRGQHPPSSSSSRPKASAGSSSASTSAYSSQSQPHSHVVYHEKRPSVSKTSTSQNVSLSNLSSSSPSYQQTQSHANVVPSSSHSQSQSQHSHSHSNSSHAHHSRSHSHSLSHSRGSSQGQQTQPQRAEPRPIMKRDPATVDGISLSTSPPAASRPHPTRSSSASAAAAAAADANQQKRQRERKASVSVSASATASATSSSQPQYSYSTSNYSIYYPYNTPNGTTPNTPTTGTSQASVQAQAHQQSQQAIAPPMSETKKHTSTSSSSSASSRDIHAGQMINPASAGPSSAVASANASKETSPQVPAMALPSQGSSSASAQAAAAEREKQRSRSNSRKRPSIAQMQAPVQIVQAQNVPVQAQAQVQATNQAQHAPAPAQVQVQATSQAQLPPQQKRQPGPRDIFAPAKFNCSQCRNLVVSTVQPQPALALTSPDAFSHPFASSLHLVCSNSACGTVHCRGCLKPVKCRDAENHDAFALVPFGMSTSPTKHTTSKVASTPRTNACGGGPGCALWSCCKKVRALAIYEALRAFDAVFGEEAGFAVGGFEAKDPQHQALGRQHREAYVKLLISKADKSMRKFEDAFVRTLRIVCSWLRPTSDSDADGDDNDSTEYERVLASLFMSSYLLEVVHAFLSNNNVRDWVAHSETYLGILEMLKRMLDSNLGEVLKEIPAGSSSSPLSTASSASASVPMSTAVYSPFASSSSASSSGPASTSHSPSTPHQNPPMSLHDLVKQLESHRRPLMAIAAKVQFSATVDKVNNLSDAISYLLLQQMVGGF